MCGFVGVVNKNGQKVDSSLLSQMASTIKHRGPDEEGLLTEDHLGFFHKRLSVIDLATGQQPMSFNNCTIVFNGEIYNYIELRQGSRKEPFILHYLRYRSNSSFIPGIWHRVHPPSQWNVCVYNF